MPLPAAGTHLEARRPIRRHPIDDGDTLAPGRRLEGRAIGEERFTTIVLYPGHKAELDALVNFQVTM